jgi:hypothetical protein
MSPDGGATMTRIIRGAMIALGFTALAGCVYAPPPAPAYGYGYGYGYAPGYYAYAPPAYYYGPPAVGLDFGFAFGGHRHWR